MSTTTKNGVKGTQGVNASQTKTNGTTANGTAAPKMNGKEAEAPAKLTPIEEQLKFFDGLGRLVSFKRRYEAHRKALAELAMPDEELAKFETDRRHGIRVVIHADDGADYEINNPKLVQEVQQFLIGTLDRKIAEYNNKIIEYGKN